MLNINLMNTITNGMENNKHRRKESIFNKLAGYFFSSTQVKGENKIIDNTNELINKPIKRINK